MTAVWPFLSILGRDLFGLLVDFDLWRLLCFWWSYSRFFTSWVWTIALTGGIMNSRKNAKSVSPRDAVRQSAVWGCTVSVKESGVKASSLIPHAKKMRQRLHQTRTGSQGQPWKVILILELLVEKVYVICIFSCVYLALLVHLVKFFLDSQNV